METSKVEEYTCSSKISFKQNETLSSLRGFMGTESLKPGGACTPNGVIGLVRTAKTQ